MPFISVEIPDNIFGEFVATEWGRVGGNVGNWAYGVLIDAMNRRIDAERHPYIQPYAGGVVFQNHARNRLPDWVTAFSPTPPPAPPSAEAADTPQPESPLAQAAVSAEGPADYMVSLPSDPVMPARIRATSRNLRQAQNALPAGPEEDPE